MADAAVVVVVVITLVSPPMLKALLDKGETGVVPMERTLEEMGRAGVMSSPIQVRSGPFKSNSFPHMFSGLLKFQQNSILIVATYGIKQTKRCALQIP